MTTPAPLKKWTPRAITALKGKGKFATLTAYDTHSAAVMDAAGMPLLLVGDSLGMAVLGYSSTVPVTMEDMIRHGAAVVRGAPHSLVVVDLPFMTYEAGPELALRSAGRILQETGCAAVKLEGGVTRAEVTRALVQSGIPVCGHIGLTPQHVNTIGFRVQGRTAEAADQLVEDAKAIEAAGAFALVVEGVPAVLGARITKALQIPVIGIGAGPDTDGQILVVNDLIGHAGEMRPKFVKAYANVAEILSQAVQSYQAEVAAGAFPAPEHCYE